MTDAARARRFGFAIAAVWSLVALSCWRHHRALPWPAPLVAALAFVAAAALAPERLVPLEAFLGRINSAIVLTMTYYLVVTPAAWLWRLAGSDPLESRERRESYWRPVEPRSDADRYERTF